MSIALEEAKKADDKKEVPVGAVIVMDNKILSKAYNQKEKSKDPTKHAEIIAIQKACKKKKSWRLNKCLLFVTLEPCTMCIGAIIESRISKIICGTKNEKFHNLNRKITEFNNIDIEIGILEDECKEIIKTFFLNKRKR